MPAIVPDPERAGRRGGGAAGPPVGRRAARCAIRPRLRGPSVAAVRRVGVPARCRWPRPRCVGMSTTQPPRRLAAPSCGSTAGRRRRRARRAVAEPGLRLHDLPAALPLPHHRPAARAAVARRACAARWCTRCSRTSSTCRRAERTPDQAPRPAGARLGGAARGRAGRSPRCSPTRVPTIAAWLASCRAVARPLLHARGPAPARAGRARAVRRDAARLPAAAARLRRPARRRARRCDPGGRLQDRAVARARCSRPRRCSR